MKRPLLPPLLLPLLPLLLLQLLAVSASTPPHKYIKTRRACYVHGPVKQCRFILADCLLKNCRGSDVCALSTSNKVICLPKTAWSFKNCGPERLRKSQPCPADAGIAGFGSGCNYCTKGLVIPASRRACVVRHTGGGIFKRKCIDISARCKQRMCPKSTVCGLDLQERIKCFPRSVKKFENCRSDSFRLQQPCPADSIIVGFGMGCTFCGVGNPFVFVEPVIVKRACVVSNFRRGTFKRKCVDISAQCKQRMCPKSTVCGLDLQGRIKCFPRSVKDFQNCRSESFRLEQPCPADSTIVGFGMGCTFCGGGGPFVGPTIPPEPTTAPTTKNACVVRHLGGGIVKRKCIDISTRCKQRMCPKSTVCGLDLQERIKCFPRSVKEFENCRSDSFRLEQPCPADSGIEGFGMGCTFCIGGNPFVQPTTPPEPIIAPTIKRACVYRHIGGGNFKRKCIDISNKCKQRMCPKSTVCGLDLQEKIKCFPQSVKEFENCRSESFRLQQPCPADAGIEGFGMGCTFCN